MSDSPSSSPEEHHITRPFSHTYCSLNQRTETTRSVWVVFHGIGFLSRYFLRHFSHLNPGENYILAPQAPSLYYLNDTYTHVGASWLTREQTRLNMDNLLAFLDGLWAAENLGGAPKLVLFGYSQGVSVLCRWVALRGISCDRMVLYAGKVPDELGPEHFRHLPPEARVEMVFGTHDPFLERWDNNQLERQATTLFGQRLSWHPFEGGHELLRECITD